MRALLENRSQTIPAERATPLRQELKLPHRFVERCFREPDDLALAGVSDFQGVGGKHDKMRSDKEDTEITS
jgi:hypothetical protein